MLLCHWVFPDVSRGSHCFHLQGKAVPEEPYVIYNLAGLNFSWDCAPRPFETLATTHSLTKESHLRRLVSSKWSQSKVMSLFATVGCLHPCHMVVTRPVVPSKMCPITLPCYSHHGNFKSDLKSFPRKWCVIAVGSPCVNILSIYTLRSFFNLMDNFRHETRQQDEVVPLSCCRNGSNNNSLYTSETWNSTPLACEEINPSFQYRGAWGSLAVRALRY